MKCYLKYRRSPFFSFYWLAAIVGSLLVAITACQPQTPLDKNGKQNNISQFYGVWTNVAFEQAVRNHNAPYNQYDCTELYISPQKTDSLWLVHCQMEVALLGYQPKGKDTLFIAEWQQKGVSIVLQPDHTLQLINHNNQTETLFTKADPAYIEAEQMPPFSYSYRKFMNANTIAGTYIDPQKPAVGKVEFNADGTTKGINRYKNYTLWVGGDYASMCQNNLISLNNGIIDTLFGWQQTGDTLAFFALKNVAQPDEKPEYIYHNKALVLLKQH